jgi:hypothetical protein
MSIGWWHGLRITKKGHSSDWASCSREGKDWWKTFRAAALKLGVGELETVLKEHSVSEKHMRFWIITLSRKVRDEFHYEPALGLNIMKGGDKGF